MSYFNGPADPDDFDPDFEGDIPNRSKRGRFNLGIFLLAIGIVGSTFAANISLGTVGKKEFGQGVFQIKACDQWVGVGVTSGQGAQNTYVANVRIMGLDPRACKGTIFRIKFFAPGSQSAMNMYYGAGTTTAANDSVTATTLTTKLTTTAYTGTTQSQYDAWAYDAMTLIDPQGRDISYGDTYETVEYLPGPGVYSIILTYPLAVATQVSTMTIETAKYA
jgi:hypothetical protein